jgi:LAO/AO transport system kinase
MKANPLLEKLHAGDRLSLARCISLVENDSSAAIEILQSLQINHKTPVIGVTGPPGAGKSTLVSALLSYLLETRPEVKIAVLAVDPTSPFTHGSLLGDRLRMTEHFNNQQVFIRSLATRGALGGLSAKTIEITDILRATDFDFIFIETVGVGQSELEIASLADTTVVVFVPESGDEIQTIKSGIMEIADLFVVNKADRDGADKLQKNLLSTLHERSASDWQVPVVKTIASSKQGIADLFEKIESHLHFNNTHPQLQNLLFAKAIRLAENYLIRKVNLSVFQQELAVASVQPHFNIYQFISDKFK